MKTTISTVPRYIASQPKEVRPLLQSLYEAIMSVAPKAKETISYGMPAFHLNEKPLVYFAAFKGHIGLYPTPGGITPFTEALKGYSVGKGCIRFPYTEKLPLPLIKKIVRSRAKELSKKIIDKDYRYR